MKFTIHFRGVAVFVAKGDRITEVLFPNAQTRPPRDGSAERLKDPNGVVIADIMRHADRFPAPRHFAGALITGPNKHVSYRSLLNYEVQVGRATAGAEVQGRFKKDLPPLVDAITVPRFAIRLLTDRKDSTRVSTFFALNDGKIFSEHQSSLDWLIRGGKHGVTTPAEKHFAGARLQIDANTPLVITLTPLPGTTVSPDGIVLDGDHDEVFFFNFDLGLPSIDDLKKVDKHDNDFLIDHDFKWVYSVFDRVDPNLDTWQKWLDGEQFPAPVRTGKLPLTPVFTCFPTVWPG